jgi:hypothetical protein
MQASIANVDTSQKNNYSWLSVEFHLHSQILNGFIRIPGELRLLDLLNMVGPAHAKSEYIEFMTVASPGGDEYREAQYIRKAAINLVATPDPNAARGAGGKSPPKPYPARDKSHVRVSVETPALSLDATMYHLPGQTIGDVLDEKTAFLPLTDVAIAREGHLYGIRPLVVVRKKQIVSLKEERLT